MADRNPTGCGCTRRTLLQAGGAAVGAALVAPHLSGCGESTHAEPTPWPHAGFVTVNGVETYYERVDQAGAALAPVVFVHGWSLDLSYWRPEVDHFGARRPVLAYDLRGMGRSGGGETDYDIAQLAADLRELLDLLQVGSPILCGHSMGGVIVLQFAMDYPDRLAAAVLAGVERQTAESQAAEQTEAAQFQAAVEQAGLEVTVPAFRDAFYSAAFQAQHPDAIQAWEQQFLGNSSASLIQGLTALADRPVLTPERLARVQVPTLALAGDQDASILLDQALDLWRSLPGVPGGPRLGVVPSGHMTLQEQPPAFIAEVEAFLSLYGLA